MSLEFNRRSFLKYSAAAAVAVAGSSLLTGCGEDEYQPTGKLGSTLKLMGEYKLKNAKLTSTSGSASPAAPSATEQTYNLVCTMDLTCTSTYGLHIWPSNFQVEVTPKNSKTTTIYNSLDADTAVNGITLKGVNNYLKKDDSSKNAELTVKNIKLREGDTIKVKFWPRPVASEGTQAYTRAYCTWTLTVANSSTDEKNLYIK